MTKSDTKIRMESEIVLVELFREYAIVECTFNVTNNARKTNLEVGFPVMDFHHHSIEGYQLGDKANYKIEVDDSELNESDIREPKEIDSVYNVFIKSSSLRKEFHKKMDSIYEVNKVKKRKNGALGYPKETNYKQNKQS